MELPVVCVNNTTKPSTKSDCLLPTIEDLTHTTDPCTKPDCLSPTTEDLTHTTDKSITMDCSSPTTENSTKPEMDSGHLISFLEKNKILLAAIGGVLLTVIIGLIVLIRCKCGKKERTQEIPVIKTMTYADVVRNQSQTDREMFASKAQSQADREMFHRDDGIYDHTDTSAPRHTEDKDASKIYDTMKNIKQETEGLYDHSINTGSRALESTALEPEGLYDHA